MISKIIFAVSIISGAGILWILNFTTPSSVGPLGVLGLFILAYIVFAQIIVFLLYGSSRIFSLVKTTFTKESVSPKKERNFMFYYKYSLALAMAPLVIIAQQSVGSVGVFELILILIIEIIACVYISKR